MPLRRFCAIIHLGGDDMDIKRRKRNTVFLVIVSICLGVSFLIVALYTAVIVSSWLNVGEITIDSEYAQYIADDEVVAKKYDIDQCATLRFFDDSESKKTLFINAVPKLEIVNDNQNYIEICTNKELLDIIDVSLSEDRISIKCDDSAYNRVHENDTSYDYDYGMYIDCTSLDITVHAPISKFYTDTNLELNFDVAKADDVIVDFSFDGVSGVISNINAKNFTLYCSGFSKLNLIGNVSDTAKIMLWHNSRVNASELTAKTWDTWVSRGMGGFSYLIRDKWYNFECDIIGGATNTVEFFVFMPFLLWLVLEIKLIKKRKTILQQIWFEN